MKTRPLFCLLWMPFLWCSYSFANSVEGTVRAVVIGISDYQDEEIPDLQFAHRDAIAFAEWMESSAGGNVPPVNIQLLLNEEATIGRIVEALGWLIEESTEGDQAVIYFSGHGDTEQITKFKRGFLLTHNAPPRSYMTGGVLALRDVRDIVTTLSESGVEVTIITDACRAGNLAGSGVNGSQFTSAQLATQYANEIKILSCQPDEYSSEGTQWGGGHGAFSYHLMDGLYGLADRDEDYQITLSEIDRYLEDHVPKEVAPLQQTPMTFGNRRALLALVDDASLAARKSIIAQSLPTIAAVKNRAFSELEDIRDTTLQKMYKAFQQTLADKQFFSPPEFCADTLYKQLINDERIQHLHSAMRRRYAAELQDDAQEALNLLLKVEPNSMVDKKVAFQKKYNEYPRYLKRASDLLGKDHYMYASLEARSIFFDAWLKWSTFSSSANEKLAGEILQRFKSSLSIEPYAPHTNYYISVSYANMMDEPDSAYHYATIATTQAPTWVLPYTSLVFFYLQKYKRFEEAQVLIERCKDIDSTHSLVLQCSAAFHFYQKEFDQAIAIYEKLLKKDSTLINVWNSLGVAYIRTRQFVQAEKAILNSVALDSTRYMPYYTLGFLYHALKRTEEAKVMLLKSIKNNPRIIASRKKLGVIFYQEQNFDLAKDIWQEAHELKPHDIELCLNLAFVSIDQGQPSEAIEYLEQAFIHGKRDYKEVVKDFEVLNDQPAYQALLKKYFPEAHQ